jgi:putative membrane protein
MKHHTTVTLGLLLTLGCLAACDNDRPSTATLTGSPPQIASDNANAPSAPAGVASPAPASPLSDAQILQVTHTANAGEIAQAKLALQKSSDARVKQLATMMIADHTSADKDGADLAQKEGLNLADSTTSTTVKSDGDHVFADLSSKSGATFDKAYVDAQVDEHTEVLRTINTQLIPAAKDGQVQTFIHAIQSKVAEHLKHAEKLQSELSK